MAKNFDLTSPQWLEMVFKGKNREYGAYTMRRNSSNRHLWAMGIVFVLVTGMMFLPGLIKSAVSANIEPTFTMGDRVVFASVTPDPPEEHVVEKPIEVPPPPDLKKSIRLVTPIIAPDNEVSPEEQMLTQRELTDSGLDISVATVLEGSDNGIDIAELEKNKVIVEKPVENKKQIFDHVQVMPMFPGGNDELMRWLSSNLTYPPIAAERGREGTVTLRFVVTETGDIGEVQLLRGADRDLDKEALRVVGKLPKFIPGRQNGQAVSVWFTLPVRFRLQQ